MDIDRRQLIGGLVPALALLATGPAAARTLEDPSDPLQRSIASVWPLVRSLPNIRVPARTPDAGGAVCYMFTNRSCTVCQGVHRLYPQGFARIEMHYIIYPWPGEDRRLLNRIYAPETTGDDYLRYMAGRLDARADSDSPVQADRILAATAKIADVLVEGGGFGTPFFLYGAAGAKPDSIAFAAGDILAVEALLDRGV